MFRWRSPTPEDYDDEGAENNDAQLASASKVPRFGKLTLLLITTLVVLTIVLIFDFERRVSDTLDLQRDEIRELNDRVEELEAKQRDEIRELNDQVEELKAEVKRLRDAQRESQ